MDPLYQEHILEHYKHPHNRRRMDNPDVTERGTNASCGDDLVLYLKWDGDVLLDISFEGFGCAISQSGASMLTDKVKGMTRDEIRVLPANVMDDLYGFSIGSSREKCALLSISTLQNAIMRERLME